MTDRIALLQKMLQEGERDPFLRYALALEFFKAGSRQGALNELDLLFRESPDYLPLYYQWAAWLLEGGEVTKAREIITLGMGVARSQRQTKILSELQSLLDTCD